MNTDIEQTIDKMLMRHEGFRDVPYKCTSNRTTIGYGRNLYSNPLTTTEAAYLLANDRNRALNDAMKIYPNFDKLNLARKCALIDFVFNVGIGTARLFKKFLACLDNEDYKGAANELLNTLYHQQTGKRAEEIAAIIRTGELQPQGDICQNSRT